MRDTFQILMHALWNKLLANHLRGRSHVIVILRRGLLGVTHEGDHARGRQPKWENKVNDMLRMRVGLELCLSHTTNAMCFQLTFHRGALAHLSSDWGGVRKCGSCGWSCPCPANMTIGSWYMNSVVVMHPRTCSPWCLSAVARSPSRPESISSAGRSVGSFRSPIAACDSAPADGFYALESVIWFHIQTEVHRESSELQMRETYYQEVTLTPSLPLTEITNTRFAHNHPTEVGAMVGVRLKPPNPDICGEPTAGGLPSWSQCL